jgi:hypothetical protein
MQGMPARLCGLAALRARLLSTYRLPPRSHPTARLHLAARLQWSLAVGETRETVRVRCIGKSVQGTRVPTMERRALAPVPDDATWHGR